jgi:hypothetical protein
MGTKSLRKIQPGKRIDEFSNKETIKEMRTSSLPRPQRQLDKAIGDIWR